MKYPFNNPIFKSRRRFLRREQTDSERLLWSRLRSKQFFGLKFFRQFSVGPYILDFYCPAKYLAIEVDGSKHLEQKTYDQERTLFLNSHRIEVVRFWSNDVMRNLEGVLQEIEKQVGPITPPAPA
ncbi:MAG: DUF559 domain-containing protein [bacterium]|nr:DUF559 domain-containing protein [bacterium]